MGAQLHGGSAGGALHPGHHRRTRQYPGVDNRRRTGRSRGGVVVIEPAASRARNAGRTLKWRSSVPGVAFRPARSDNRFARRVCCRRYGIPVRSLAGLPARVSPAGCCSACTNASPTTKGTAPTPASNAITSSTTRRSTRAARSGRPRWAHRTAGGCTDALGKRAGAVRRYRDRGFDRPPRGALPTPAAATVNPRLAAPPPGNDTHTRRPAAPGLVGVLRRTAPPEGSPLKRGHASRA